MLKEILLILFSVLGFGISFHIWRKVHKQKKKLSIKREIFDNTDFKKLWGKINQKTRFSVEYSTDDLVKNCVERVNRMEKIEPLKIVVRKAEIEVDKSGVHTKEKRHQVTLVEKTFSLPDILTYLQRETELTRNTIFRILSECERLDDFNKNPQMFMDNVVNIINSELRKLMIDGIKYEKIGGEEYEMRLFEEKELVDYLTNIVEVKKSIYDSIVFDSQVERRFAQELDERDDIKLFLKLPKWFTVTTPLGEYNPDWAILKENDEGVQANIKKLIIITIALSLSGGREAKTPSPKTVCSFRART